VYVSVASYFIEKSCFLLNDDIVLTCLSTQTIQHCLLKCTLIYYTMTGTQSLSVISNWFVAHRHLLLSASISIILFSLSLSFIRTFFWIVIPHQGGGDNRLFSEKIGVKATTWPSRIAELGKNYLALWMRGQCNLGQNNLLKEGLLLWRCALRWQTESRPSPICWF